MNAEDLTPDQLLILSIAGLFSLTLIFGSLLVHAWVLVAWRRVMSWSGWLKDQVHDRIGLIDIFCLSFFFLVAQFAVAGIFYQQFKRGLPSVPTPSESADAIPVPASLIPVAIRSSVEPNSSSEPMPLIESPWFMFAATGSLVLGVFMSAIGILVRTKTTPWTIGMISGRLARELMVGLLAFFWITPIVLLINIGASQLTEIQYEHPVIDSLRGKAWAFPLLFLSAAVFAPIWEEYAFRFLLVNWLDTFRHHGFRWKQLLFGQQVSPDIQAKDDWHISDPSVYPSQPGNSESTAFEAGSMEPSDANETLQATYPPWWIAITSGLIFGLAHFEYGISWVPLVVLGTALARIYQLQRSILPCILIHALFNSLAMIGFAVELFVKPNP
jgi:membrane protease YdiL (CAAX protease family)